MEAWRNTEEIETEPCRQWRDTVEGPKSNRLKKWPKDSGCLLWMPLQKITEVSQRGSFHSGSLVRAGHHVQIAYADADEYAESMYSKSHAGRRR